MKLKHRGCFSYQNMKKAQRITRDIQEGFLWASAWKTVTANQHVTKAVRNKKDHSTFVSGDPHSGKSDNTKKQTNTICSPKAQEDIDTNWWVTGSDLFSYYFCRFFCSPSLLTKGTHTAEVFTERKAERVTLPKLLPWQTNVLSFFLNKQQEGCFHLYT